ncbi:hypothetical protein MMAD_50420 [Mycolicibacterium madagascariense]|uniref:Transmembrane protein n=1 Tax=Mycolicibacterium madagascariense TaxID=212765 RepID=A0A7I7XND7_9MYCO|nr:hypothetical protein [Mycolicibacterium madagascariense]MCV7012681.1 hypothetical protein [Mycolicibacterium madagascariense]BBZ30747.1 hypothetical protein MMAD_50420 [Mycolicibacterium madagascariense]
MRRWIAVLWHASFFVIAAALYFFFVLPRWFELTGEWSSSLGLAMRILCGALLGLAALPVVFTLLRTRRPEFGTPRLALTLRLWSIVLHVLAGALVVGAAISEIWVSLDTAGQSLFAIYGAAAAIAILGALAFYLAFAAELPPPPPKPLRPKGRTRRRGRGAAADDEATDTEDADEITETTEDGAATDETAEITETTETTETTEADETPVPAGVGKTESAEVSDTAEDAEPDLGNAEASDADASGSTLRNRRPEGKSTSRLFGRSRRGVALDD